MAVVRSKAAVKTPKLMVGNPSPMTPLTLPATKNVTVIIISENVSMVQPVFLNILMDASSDTLLWAT